MRIILNTLRNSFVMNRRILCFVAGIILSFTLIAQNKTIDIDSATFNYNTSTKQFEIGGIFTGTSMLFVAELPASDPYLIVLIETGDGNYIKEKVSYNDLQDSVHQMPQNGTFEYNHAGSFNVVVRIVKTYDKGGPRTKQLSATVSPPYNPNARNSLPYSGPGVTMFVLDSFAVGGDTTTGVITINNTGSPLNNAEFELVMDDLLEVCGVRYQNSNISTGKRQYISGLSRLPFTINSISPGEIIIIFFDIYASSMISALPEGHQIPLHLDLSKMKPPQNSPSISLFSATAHDPNDLNLMRPLSCQTLSNRIIWYVLDIENTGIGDEKNISVALAFDTTLLNKHSLKILCSQFGETNVAAIVRKNKPYLQNMPGSIPITLLFNEAMLEGINRLQSGDIKTKGRVVFQITLKKNVNESRNIPMQAIIRFGDARQNTPTKVQLFNLSTLKRICQLHQTKILFKNPSPKK